MNTIFPTTRVQERGAILDALEEILKSESDPERRKVARRRYLDLTDPKEESHVTDRA